MADQLVDIRGYQEELPSSGAEVGGILSLSQTKR